jgi:hypothetical protein
MRYNPLDRRFHPWCQRNNFTEGIKLPNLRKGKFQWLEISTKWTVTSFLGREKDLYWRGQGINARSWYHSYLFLDSTVNMYSHVQSQSRFGTHVMGAAGCRSGVQWPPFVPNTLVLGGSGAWGDRGKGSAGGRNGKGGEHGSNYVHACKSVIQIENCWKHTKEQKKRGKQ